MAMFVKDMAYLGPLQGMSCGPRDRFARVLAVVHAPVPCKEELCGTKSSAVPCTILLPMSPGFSSAPFTQPKKGQAAAPPKDGEPILPLFAMDNSTSPPEIDVWSYISKGMNRGIRQGPARDEGSDPNAPSLPMYKLATGTTFVMFVNALTFQSAAATSVLPDDRDWIPAMSIVELLITPRHSESCLNGRGINVKSMRVSTIEMDAVFQNGIDAIGMSFNAIDASRIANERRERYPAILKDVEVDKVSFVVRGSSLTQAYMGDLPSTENMAIDSVGGAGVGDTETAVVVPEFVKICIGNGHPSFPNGTYLDVAIECLQKQTNTRSDTHACAMLDIAFAMGAVDLFCITDDRFASRGNGSPYRVVPVINTKIMFASLSRVRSIEKDHAMVAVSVKGVEQLDADNNVIIERINLHDEDDGSDDDNPIDGSGRWLTLNTGVEYDDGILELTVKVDDENTNVGTNPALFPQQNAALALVGPNVATSKGYAFSFSVKCASDESRNVDGVLTGLVNRASGVGGSGGISRKRRAVSMR
jgi:hypothetical protein